MEAATVLARGVQQGSGLDLPPEWPTGVAALALLLVWAGAVIWSRTRLMRAGIRQIDRMDGATFEQCMEGLFRRLGYCVERTVLSGDYGGDLVVERDGERTVVQTKRYQGRVGVKSVQEAVAARGYYQCARAMVVTNSHFTAPAVTLAEANDVTLWDRERLVEALLRARIYRVRRFDPEEAPEAPLPTGTPRASFDAVVCAACGAPVSESARAYCAAHPDRFGGRTYCPRDQVRIGARSRTRR